MKYLIAIFIPIIALLIAPIAFAEPLNFGLDRLEGRSFTFREMKKELSCYPTLISRWNKESGFAREIKISVGNIEFVRTDVGEPDGSLHVLILGKKVCEIELSLMPNIYYNSKDKLLFIYGYSGSNHFIEMFSLANECQYIGYARLDTKSDLDEVKVDWYHQPDGKKICNNTGHRL